LIVILSIHGDSWAFHVFVTALFFHDSRSKNNRTLEHPDLGGK